MIEQSQGRIGGGAWWWGTIVAPGSGLAPMSYVELGLGVLGGLASAATIEKVRAAAAAPGPVVDGGAAGMPHPHGWTAGGGQGRWGSAGMEPEEAHTRKKHMQRMNWRKKHARGRTERGRRGRALSSR
jgi:hypothetical protein